MVFPRFFQGLPSAERRRLRAAPGFALFLPSLRERLQGATAERLISVGGCKSAPWLWQSPEWHCLVLFDLWVGQLESMGVAWSPHAFQRPGPSDGMWRAGSAGLPTGRAPALPSLGAGGEAEGRVLSLKV